MRVRVERGAFVASDDTLAEYAGRWMRERPLLRVRTRELYEGLLRLHVLPSLGAVSLCDIKPAVVRSWHASMLSGPRPGASTAAKSYGLLYAATQPVHRRSRRRENGYYSSHMAYL